MIMMTTMIITIMVALIKTLQLVFTITNPNPNPKLLYQHAHIYTCTCTLYSRVYACDDTLSARQSVMPHLLSEPLVEFFIRVKHQPISLGALLALGHQGRELISLK